MRSLLTLCVIVALALTAGVACAAQPGQVPDMTLAQLGLGGMHQMTDAQATAIRGNGFAFKYTFGYTWSIAGATASGSSTAHVSGGH
jgi:ABC-type proline/glycine betaine transport system substrate-binding protein